jgi:putative transposase
VKEMRLRYSIPRMCRFFNVSASGYYKWLTRPLSQRVQEEGRLEAEIRAAHMRTRKTYGPERLQKDLAEHGVNVGICKIRRIRKKLGIRCKQIKKFKTTTDSRHSLPVAENLLEQRFETTAPNRVWVSDLTYISTEEGWLYCAAHKDPFNGEIIGYALGPKITTDLVKQSLMKAVTAKRPPSGLIHHSDRGIQYCAHGYQKLLVNLGMKVSMSRKGNCYDNAPMESFWGTLKNELVHDRHFVTREEAMREITEYIEVFYNRERRQKRLGYLSPVVYGREFYVQGVTASRIFGVHY